MSRTMVGLLAAVGAIMSALVGLTHGGLEAAPIAIAAAATGLTAYLALPSSKKSFTSEQHCR
jgi:hypothetical protein